MALQDSFGGIVDNFGVTPNHDRGDIETLGSPAETDSGGIFGFLGKVVNLAGQGASIYKDFNTDQANADTAAKYSQDTSNLKPGTVNYSLPPWLLPVGIGLIVLASIWAFVKFSK